MTWKHWVGVVLGAAVGVGIAVGVRKLRIYSEARALERTGEITYR